MFAASLRATSLLNFPLLSQFALILPQNSKLSFSIEHGQNATVTQFITEYALYGKYGQQQYWVTHLYR